MLLKALQNARRKMVERGWDKIYVAVDWHDTVCRSTYSEGGAYSFYGAAISALQAASENPKIDLILYTSSYASVVEDFVRFCRAKHGINFKYFNANPEIKNTNYGEFGKKFYYDVLLDDKAGFDPATDWKTFGAFARSL